MGKHGKNNKSSMEVQTIRKKKKDELKKNISNYQSHQGKVMSKQNVELPKLQSHKANIIKDIQNKKVSNARTELIDSLNNRLSNDNINANKISMGHLIEGAYQAKTLSNYHQADSILKNMDYLNREEDSGFFGDDIKGNKVNFDSSKKTFLKDLNQVIEGSDVILEVLDARDPMAYRSLELESQIKSYKDTKKIILVINKIDLVTPENAQGWKELMSQEYPCVLFKANTQNQNSNLSNTTIFHSSFASQKDFIDEILSSNKAVGGEDLMNIMKNFCRIEGSDQMKSIVVGIVGFPNVGKSSIINSLKRGKAVGVSSTPGYTKAISEIKLDKNIKLLDCPGVVYSSNPTQKLLSNILRPEQIEDPVNVVRVILQKADRNEIIKIYDLEKDMESNSANKALVHQVFSSRELDINEVEKFLCFVGMKHGKYKKGGIIDLPQTAVMIIQDWNKGKIKYMTPLPNTYINRFMSED